MTIPLRLARWASHVIEAGRAHKVDPLLLLAIMDRESRGGEALTPRGPGGTGDHGHGRGLMQIDDRAHAEWVGTNDWTDPSVNIAKGAEVLASGMKAFPRSLRAAVASYNCGVGNVRRALARGLHVDHYTTGRDYSADVLRRWEQLRQAQPGLSVEGK